MEEEFKEIARLFQEANSTLNSSKCRVTAKATFNRAMTMLHALEKDSDPDVARAAKQMHAQAKEAIGKDKSLHATMRAYAMVWREN